MKKTVLILGILISSFSFAQMAVIDATANQQMAKQISQSVAQVKQLEKTYDVLKKADEKIKQVSGYVQQAGYLQNIISKQKEAINTANEILKLARSQKNISLAGVEQNLRMISGSVKTVQALLQNGIFNMNDSERLNRLDSEYKNVSASTANIKAKLIQLSFR